MQETRAQSLGREDPLAKGKATHSTVLAREIPWTKEPGGLQSKMLQELFLKDSLEKRKMIQAGNLDIEKERKRRNW